MRLVMMSFVVFSALASVPAAADVPGGGLVAMPGGTGSAVVEPAVIRDWQPAPRAWQPYRYGSVYPRWVVPSYRYYGWQRSARPPGSVPYRRYVNRYVPRPWTGRSYAWRSAPQYRSPVPRYRVQAQRVWVDRRDWRW